MSTITIYNISLCTRCFSYCPQVCVVLPHGLALFRYLWKYGCNLKVLLSPYRTTLDAGVAGIPHRGFLIQTDAPSKLQLVVLSTPDSSAYNSISPRVYYDKKFSRMKVHVELDLILPLAIDLKYSCCF